MHERQHTHAAASHAAHQREDDAFDTRDRRSSRLDAPARPIASGLIARKGDDGIAADAEDRVAAAHGSSGSPLPGTIMRKFEAALGADLSSVRVHTGPASAAAARSVGARAYAIGQDIHFGSGQFDPSSPGGEHLLAHEVAHTVQQRGGSPRRQHKLEVSSPHDAAEHEADRAADAMVAGRSFAIGSASAGAARSIFRKDAKQNQVNPKLSFDIKEVKLGEKKLRWVKLAASYKAKGSIEAQEVENGKGISSTVTVGPTGIAGQGATGGKAEIELAKQEFHHKLLGIELDEKLKEKFSFELSREKLDVSVGVEGRVNVKELPWLKGAGDLSFKFASVKWKDMQKDPDHIEKVKVLALEGGLGLNGEGTLVFAERAYKAGVTSQVVVSASPNWAEIGAEVAKQAAEKGAETAATTGAGGAAGSGATATTATTATTTGAGGTGTVTGGATTTTGAAGAAAETAIVVDTAGVAASAAAIVLPLGFAALAIAGARQEEKNARASHAAIRTGLVMRDEARRYVRAYTTTLRGGSAEGPGALVANAKVMEYMAATGKNRADACADLVQRNGGVEKLEAEIMAKVRAEAYAKGVAEFERAFADQFGWLEKLGETWGMRGTFRKDLYMVLYSD